MLLRAESSKTKREWVIPIIEPLVLELEGLKANTEKRLGRRVLPDDQVFCVQRWNTSYKGEVTTVGQVSGFFRRIKDETGVVVSPHRFRHTVGTKVAATGKIRDLQQLLGHTDVRTTLGYVQPDIGVMRDMLGAMGSI
jgi:integrase